MHEAATHTSSAPPDNGLPANVRGCWFWAGWEPDRYYRRIGARKTPYFGNGEWVRPWREKLESQECLESLAEAGATVLVTRFYKGFGPEIEREDWPSLRDFIQRAHECRLEVWGYLQGQSLFGEFLFNERPEASGWIAQNASGGPQLWAGAYNRYAPCLSNPDYRQMMEDIVEEGLCSLNLDGIHMDNNYYRHCYCPRCKDLFREWLSNRGDLEQRTGIPSVDFVEPPPLIAEAALIPDPLAVLWIEFGVHIRAEFMQAMQKTVRESKPGASLAGNPAFFRTYSSRLTHALDPTGEGALCDSICVENGNQPRFENGKLFTQADKHLFAQAAGLKTWVTSWRPGQFGSSPPASALQIWAGLSEEFSFSNAFLGNNWALRPAGDGDKFLLERLTEQWQTFTEALSFFQSLDRKLDTPRRQWGEIALYVDTRSLSLCPNTDARIVQSFVQASIRRNLPFQILLRGQPVPSETHTVLVVQQSALEGEEFERLSAAVQANRGELWTIGECGIYDEWCVPRSRAVLHAWAQLPHRRSFPITAEKWIAQDGESAQYLKGQSRSLTPIALQELTHIFDLLSVRQHFRLECPPGIFGNVESFGKDAWFIHLRNLGADSPDPVRVKLRLAHSAKREVLGYSPDWSDARAITPVGWEGDLQIDIPLFASYAGLRIQQARSTTTDYADNVDHQKPRGRAAS